MRKAAAFFCFFNFVIAAFAASGDTADVKPQSQKYFIVNNISISGNNKTKSRIIFRELPFHSGDTIQQNKLDAVLLRAKNNVFNTFLFIFVRIDTIPFYQNHIDIHIDVKERWYIFPVPIFEISERNFNTWLQNPNLKRTSYGFYVIDENFRGLKQNLALKIRLGYAEQYELTYSVPYINSKQVSGLGFGFSYNRNHEIPYATVNNQLMYYKNTESYVRNEWVGRTTYTRRMGLYNTQTAELRYVQSGISDSVLSLTNDYFSGHSKSFQLFIATLAFRRDYRDNRVYPLKGYYYNIDFVKQGLGLDFENTNFLYATASCRKYWNLYKRFYFAAALKGKLSTYGKQPYYIQRALGYGDYVRGYELYVIDGQSYALLRTNLRYQLIKPRVLHVDMIPTEKFNTIPYAFYLSAFFDGAYTVDNFYYKKNPLTNDWLFGGGAGLDFVSYYNTVVRFEYSWNKMGQGGFYIHFMAPF
ncbi:MAG: hypothetical protein IT235_05790 [Bacteroidia bacterium]|nr:hypothetical protein [Bacteroidia bacterium]